MYFPLFVAFETERMVIVSDFTAGSLPYRYLADWLHIPYILACFEMVRLPLAMHVYPITFSTPHEVMCGF